MQPAELNQGRWNIGTMLGRLVSRYWAAIIVFWIIAAIASRMFAPSWDSIAYDGDFDYLPANMPSVAGARMLDEAFPRERARSQILVLMTRESSLSDESASETLSKNDAHVGLDLVRRLYHKLAEASLTRAIQLGWDGQSNPTTVDVKGLVERGLMALDEAIKADELYFEYFSDRIAESNEDEFEANESWPRLAVAYWDRAFVHRALGNTDLAAQDTLIADELYPEAGRLTPIGERNISGWENLLDVLTWNDPVIGHRLSPPGARLVILRLSSELAAVGNIATLDQLERLIINVRGRNEEFVEQGLRILPTGTAAIGGETLRASVDAIRYTELFTVGLILVMLAAIYRSPLLVLIPLVSIVIAVVCSMGLVALIASASDLPGMQWVDLKIFTTSRIFVVVILFGAGTDYCLFLIARLREEAGRCDWNEAVERGLSRVSDALIGSALTTVVGLAMLWVADFGKFHYSGPVIAICLLVALAVCTTFTPALLRLLGPLVFWPSKLSMRTYEVRSTFWDRVAVVMTRRPVLVLTMGMALLVPPAIYGVVQESEVTYDISSELSPESVSRQGIEYLRRTLSLGEANPITLLIVRRHDASRDEMEKEIRELAEGLYKIEGVVAVRHATDPLGDYPPGTQAGLFDRNAWRRRALQSHRISQQFFWSDVKQYANRLVRLDVVTASDPFQKSSAVELSAIRDFLDQVTRSPDSVWSDGAYAAVGTVPSITDLRKVTGSDSIKIKIWVVVAVLLVLVFVLRRITLSLYMIVTVLISYYATLGITGLFFQFAYGDTYSGLDWKVPIFLFVILVAVGQDYNVYLVTRIIEERKDSHPISAVRKAVARTGGIITSCGVVMAGTFFSMTASAWVPGLLSNLGVGATADAETLRGITELGFALGFGVLLDTFYVRTVLVPAFCVLGQRTATIDAYASG